MLSAMLISASSAAVARTSCLLTTQPPRTTAAACLWAAPLSSRAAGGLVGALGSHRCCSSRHHTTTCQPSAAAALPFGSPAAACKGSLGAQLPSDATPREVAWKLLPSAAAAAVALQVDQSRRNSKQVCEPPLLTAVLPCLAWPGLHHQDP
jgi:hypothetical protein